MKIAQAAAVALALFAASPAASWKAKGADAVLAQMPKELGGAPAKKTPEGILMYFLKGPSGGPLVVGVMVLEKDGISSPEEMRGFARQAAAGESGLREVVREGTFATPKWPGAATFFGDYVTGEFSHQSWTLLTGKEVISVIATYDGKEDARRAEALVADRIFRGAVISADKPAE